MKLGLGAGAGGTGAALAAGGVRLADSLLAASNRLAWAALVSLKSAAAFWAVRAAGEESMACWALAAQADAKMNAIPKIGFFIPIVLRLS